MKTKRIEKQQNFKKLFLNKEKLVSLNSLQMNTLLGDHTTMIVDDHRPAGGAKTTQ